MSYFKKGKVVVNTPVAPLSFAGVMMAIIDGNLFPMNQIPLGDIAVDGIVTDNAEPWGGATELEYLVYKSNKLKLEALAGREIQSKMWALNNADEATLRLGGNYPPDKKPLNMISVQDKLEIITLTQHWYRSDRPSVDITKQSTWVNWILNTRRVEPFVYLGSVIDTTEEE